MPKEKPKQIYILGASSMAKETFQIFEDLDQENLIAGFIVENEYLKSSPKIFMGKPVIAESKINPSGNSFIAAIGSPLKRSLIERLKKQGGKFVTVSHPTVGIAKDVKIGHGSIIMRGVIMTRDIKIGRHNIINIKTCISHDCRIGDYVSIAPGVTIGGNVTIGHGTWIGIGATVIQGVKIGTNSFIGAGAVVVKDIPSNTLAYGVPAKPIRKLIQADWQKLI